DYNSVAAYASGAPLGERWQTENDRRLEDVLKRSSADAEARRRRGQRDEPLEQTIARALPPMGLSTIQTEELNFALGTEVGHEIAADLDQLSSFYWDEGRELRGGDAMLPG